VRLAGFEPATRCLEDMASSYGNVRHLGFVAVGIHQGLSDAEIVGVSRGVSWPARFDV